MFKMKYTIILLLCGFVTLSSCNDFHIQGGGHFELSKDDVGIRFYLTVGNYGNNTITVRKAHEPECCWQVEPGDTDCHSMKLFGGYSKQIKVGSKMNITYVFSNMYPHERVGECKFFLKSNQSESESVVYQANFNTSEGPDTRTFFQRLYKDGPLVLKRCKGVDENPRNNCVPVSCQEKYAGFRNFYNAKRGKCVPVHRCRTTIDKDNLPTTAFDLEHNRCKSLLGEVNEDEKKVIDDIFESSPLKMKMNPYKDVQQEEITIDCNHGERKGNKCECDKGWSSVSYKDKTGRVKKKWCSKKMKKQKKHLVFKKIFFALLGCVGVVMMVVLLFVCGRLFIREILPQPHLYNLLQNEFSSDEAETKLDEQLTVGEKTEL